MCNLNQDKQLIIRSSGVLSTLEHIRNAQDILFATSLDVVEQGGYFQIQQDIVQSRKHYSKARTLTFRFVNNDLTPLKLNSF